MADPATTSAIVLGVILCGLFTILVLIYSSHWRSGPKPGTRPPKGSFGWPIIGETFALIRDPIGFAISHQERYGSIFKSSLLMQKSIVGTTPEFAKFVLVDPALFPVIFPISLDYLLPISMRSVNEPQYMTSMKVFNKFVLPESLEIMLITLESIIVENLGSWEEKGMVVGCEVVEKLVADTSSYIAFGIKNIRRTAEGRSALKNMVTSYEGLYTLPINLPGTAHNKGRKAARSVKLYLRSILQQRRSQEDTCNDMLRMLIDAAREGVTHLDDDTIVEHLMGTWIGAFVPIATTLTWVLKFFVDYPDIFKRVQAEQQEILRGKDLSTAGPKLTFKDTKKMVYTTKFFREVHRKLSIAKFVMRKAAQDIEFDGFLIPKGWAVVPMINFVHADPANYEDPLTFNPDRFDTPPKPGSYLPFSTGPHRCRGEEIAKLTTLIYIHHLSTKYIYESVGPDRGKKFKFHEEIVGGYPINIRRRN